MVTAGASVAGGLLVGPAVARAATTVTFTVIPLASQTAGANALALGPDGNLWSTEIFAGKIARITPVGAITEFAVPNTACLVDIVAGADGNMWFTDLCSNFVGRITMDGVVSEFPVPPDPVLTPWRKQGLGQAPAGITAGPDGSLWVAEFGTDRILQIDTSGHYKKDYQIPRHKKLPKGDPDASGPDGITTGPDGNLWFTESRFGGGTEVGNRITRLTPDGTFTEFPIPTADSRPHWITTGPDGNLWFTEENGNNIGRITTAGAISEYAVPTASSIPDQIVTGPDGALWFTEAQQLAPGLAQITTAGAITEFTSPSRPDVAGSIGAVGIGVGSDGNIWFTELEPNTLVRAVISS